MNYYKNVTKFLDIINILNINLLVEISNESWEKLFFFCIGCTGFYQLQSEHLYLKGLRLKGIMLTVLGEGIFFFHISRRNIVF